MADLIKDLLDTEPYPEETKKVSLVQTHISLVFITDDYVYKIKKPVDFGFLDFTDLKKREYYCHQEVKLNQRLSKDIYLGVLPIRFDGKLHRLGGRQGEIVEYAVKMIRIPEDRLMKTLFNKHELDDNHLREIAKTLADFHKRAESSSKIDGFGRPEVFRINTDENFEQTKKYIGRTIEKETYESLRSWTDTFYKDHEGLFRERINAGMIRDCHGDLHMEHVCLIEPLAIIDCIEFNDRFRFSDTLADMAFLIMDLEFWGGREQARRLWEVYAPLSNNVGKEDLLAFYKVYRAYVRGKVNSFQADDDRITSEEKNLSFETARKYFELAHDYIDA